jgi:hypothetical protein
MILTITNPNKKGRCIMSELDRVEQIRRDTEAGNRAGDELTIDIGTRTIGPSSSSDPDKAVRITKPDTDLFGRGREKR